MTWLSTGIFLLIVGLFLRELAILLRARVPTQTRAVMVGDNAPLCQDEIPRIIWTYWQPAPAPAFIQACLANWRRFAPDHDVRLLSRDDIAQWLPTLRTDFDTLPASRQADWLRSQLLARHGGVWMDAGMLMSRDLGWLHETRRRRAADYVGFYLDRDTTRPQLPIVERFMMASVAHGPFITALASAFDRALNDGAPELLRRLRDEGRDERVLQALPQQFPLMQAVAGDLLDRDPQLARLVLLRAEDGPLAWHVGVGWRARRLHARLALLPCPRVMPAVLKLHRGERVIAERNWRRGLVSPFSALRHLIEGKL